MLSGSPDLRLAGIGVLSDACVARGIHYAHGSFSARRYTEPIETQNPPKRRVCIPGEPGNSSSGIESFP
jgi:hypothetical protein